MNREIEINELVNGNAIKIGSFQSGSPEWHAARKGCVGGSEISAIVGLNPWESRFSLYYRKRDQLMDIEVTGPIEWGTRLEPVVYEKYEEGLEPGYTMTTGDTFRDINRPWMNVNPDGLIWDENGNLVRILEIKTSGRGDGFGAAGSNVVPIYYLCQVLWYAAVMKCDDIQIAVLIGGNDYRVYNIKFSAEDAQFLIEAGEKFIADLADGVEPNIHSDMATYEAIREMNPHIDVDVEVDIPAELADEYVTAVKAFAAAKADKVRMDSQILNRVGTAKYIYSGEDLIARRQMAGRGNVPYLRCVAAEKPEYTSVLEAVSA